MSIETLASPSYEEKRATLGNISLADLRMQIMRSRGLIGGDDVLNSLNGHSTTALKDYLEETLYRPKSSSVYYP